MSHHINFILAVIALFAIFGMFAASGEPVITALKGTPAEPLIVSIGWPNTIVFNLSVGYLITVFFWLLVVYLPEKNRRNLIRDNLSRHYQDFKEDVVLSLLWASETNDLGLAKQLAQDHKKFKAYFDEDSKRHWYAALNGVQGSADRMRELTLALQMLYDEVAYALNNVPIQDPSVHRVFKSLNESVYRLQHSDLDEYDQVKHVVGFLWEILARWSFAGGQSETDVIQEMINRL